MAASHPNTWVVKLPVIGYVVQEVRFGAGCEVFMDGEVRKMYVVDYLILMN